MGLQPFIGQIMIVSFGFAPKGWALCNGQLLPINQNQALFAILGTTYGGDGRTTFGLPNLQGRVPLHMSNTFTLGARGGEEAHTLAISELPGHSHGVIGSSNPADTASPIGAFLADSNNTNYVGPAAANSTFSSATVLDDGGGQPHENRSPFLALNFAVALVGTFPTRT
ncbi:MAG TPA: tail fiber protein [Acidimicrobiales bacterium]|jgi:microcystin-dependent protein|nr:tail fiber protein [Acidimicrobiales bacterium]